ncbi:hypothetical protein CTAYLR_010662 [Chrysophaeum taylorii]|uniref:SET domain-containing protein n=1 Tax=Chrysophaeum taylorii TaxID=2483200 RepID=A0AAD7XJW3_9STRA|nr:hypothetical protein CTAYLR_010662 [Chrysophaeum taylorii]
MSRVDAVARMEEWFVEVGGSHELVAAAEILNEGIGLVATRDVRAGEVLVRTPRHVCLAAADGPAWLRQTVGSAAGLTAAGAVACRVCDELALGEGSAFVPFFASLPTMEDLSDVPALWPDGAELLAGSQSGRSRREILDRWQVEFDEANARRATRGEPPYDWTVWCLAQTLVMSRGYNVPRFDYAVVPFVDLVNHADRPSAEVDFCDDAVRLVARRDVSRGEQVYATYSGGGTMDGLKMLQAFGWLPDEVVAACSVDCVEALRTRDAYADAKIALMDAGAPGAGRVVVAGDDDVPRAARAALVGFRLAAMTEDELAATADAADASPWYLGYPVSDANERRARDSAIGLLKRKLQALDAEEPRRRRAAVVSASRRRADLAAATVLGERRALRALVDWFVAYNPSGAAAASSPSYGTS